MINSLKKKYEQIRPKLKEDLGYKNINQVPKITKVVINSGVGRANTDSKQLDFVVETLTKISGQKPLITKAKKSIAGFKIRENMPIGAKVTLRGERMYDFLDRLINVVIPRMRDFRGLTVKAFDPSGNYSIGVREHTVFPEISQQEANLTHGLQVQLVIASKDVLSSEKLLRQLGFPLERSDNG